MRRNRSHVLAILAPAALIVAACVQGPGATPTPVAPSAPAASAAPASAAPGASAVPASMAPAPSATKAGY